MTFFDHPINLVASSANTIGPNGDPVGSLLIYRLIQDATGAGTAVWDSMFGTESPGQPSPKPNTYSAFLFIKSDSGHCRLLGPPVIGRLSA